MKHAWTVLLFVLVGCWPSGYKSPLRGEQRTQVENAREDAVLVVVWQKARVEDSLRVGPGKVVRPTYHVRRDGRGLARFRFVITAGKEGTFLTGPVEFAEGELPVLIIHAPLTETTTHVVVRTR